MTRQKLTRSYKDLIKQGEEDGFLVQDDILLVYPEPEHHVDEIDLFFHEALEKGIDIFETVSTRDEEDARKSAEEIEREIEFLITSRHGESLDPIKKYLKEIGKTPLLKFDEEVALAKRYENDDAEAKEMLIKA